VPRIVESRTCGGCGDPSGDELYCAKCAREIADLERLLAESSDEDVRRAVMPEAAETSVERVKPSRRLLDLAVNCVAVVLLLIFEIAVTSAFTDWFRAGGVQ
jgi:uncharacterized membrane protein YvbJ